MFSMQVYPKKVILQGMESRFGPTLLTDNPWTQHLSTFIILLWLMSDKFICQIVNEKAPESWEWKQ
jgi:hypothetical protein